MTIREKLEASKNGIDALLAFANGVTGAEDTTIGDAVKTLADGYGSGGGGDTLGESLDGTLTEYTSDVTKISGQYALAYRTNLVSVSLPNVTSLPGNTFIGCSKLEAVSLPALKTMASNEFKQTGLKRFVSGSAFDSRVDISCFEGCKSLTMCDFAHVTNLGFSNYVFSGTALDTLIIRNTDAVPPISSYTFGTNASNGCPIYKGTGRILVPRAMVDSYKASNIWSNYAAQIAALEDYTDDGTVTGRFVG